MRIFLAHTPEMRANYYGDDALAGLRALGEVTLNETDRHLGVADLIDRAAGCQVIVSDRMTPGEAALFAAAPDLVAFVRCAVDIRTVDVDAASANGVLVTHASPGFIDSVTELVVGFMVDLGRGVSGAAAGYHAGETPGAAMGTQLAGATLGVLGYGAIGMRLAEVGRALGMNVLVNDPYKTASGFEQVERNELLARADFVVCLVVANEETENLMDAAAFTRMRPGTFFVNVSRGNLVDEAALAAALTSGVIAGAALDVGRAPDQMPSPDLAALPNVIATPHIGGLTPAAVAAQALETVEQVGDIVAGKLPVGAVNAATATRFNALKR